MTNEIAKLFMDTVKGRYPISSTISSARFWIPKDDIELTDSSGDPIDVVGKYVPRPDLSMDSLKFYTWFGFLGLDHFYLRSPGTGIAKLLTLGGFGFWWLWDILQIFTETDRILDYGLSTPFDTQTGIGQGMLHEGSSVGWKYDQRSNFSLWIFATLVGFTGLDMFLVGRYWLGFRKFLIFMITISALAPMIVVYMQEGAWSAVKSAGFFGIFWKLFCAGLAFGVMGVWIGNVSMIFNNPDKLMSDGLQNSQASVEPLNWIKKLYVTVDDNGTETVKAGLEQEYASVKAHYFFTTQGISGNELQKNFYIARSGEVVPSSMPKTEPAGFIPFTLVWRIFLSLLDWMWSVGESIAKRFGKKSGGGETQTGGGGETQTGGGGETQTGGSRSSSGPKLSTEAQVMGATVAALIAGGSLKGLVDYLMKD